jgi:hypothetical protein
MATAAFIVSSYMRRWSVLSGFFPSRDASVVVRPETLLRWHRKGWKRFSRWKSRPGRPPIPSPLQALIRQMARENPTTWCQRGIDLVDEQREPAGATVIVYTTRIRLHGSGLIGRQIVKWTGMYLVGFIILLGGLLAALWKLGILARIGTTWTVIGVVIAIGIGIMVAVSNSGAKENIEIQRK